MLSGLVSKRVRAAPADSGKPRASKGVAVPDLAQLFHVGQLVRCVIAELQDKDGAAAGKGGPVGTVTCSIL